MTFVGRLLHVAICDTLGVRALPSHSRLEELRTAIDP